VRHSGHTMCLESNNHDLACIQQHCARPRVTTLVVAPFCCAVRSVPHSVQPARDGLLRGAQPASCRQRRIPGAGLFQ
jgi:hypothetical protein